MPPAILLITNVLPAAWEAKFVDENIRPLSAAELDGGNSDLAGLEQILSSNHSQAAVARGAGPPNRDPAPRATGATHAGA